MKPLTTFLLLFSISIMLSSCGAFKDDCDCPNVGYKEDIKERAHDQDDTYHHAQTSD